MQLTGGELCPAIRLMSVELPVGVVAKGDEFPCEAGLPGHLLWIPFCYDECRASVGEEPCRVGGTEWSGNETTGPAKTTGGVRDRPPIGAVESECFPLTASARLCNPS